MKRFIPLCLLLQFAALALEGEVRTVARLYAQPDPKARVIATLTAKTELDIKSCTGGSKGWCLVTAGKLTGFIPRAQVYGYGKCADLIAVGMKDLRPGEASYKGRRDRDGDGLGCDKVE